MTARAGRLDPEFSTGRGLVSAPRNHRDGAQTRTDVERQAFAAGVAVGVERVRELVSADARRSR
jgi:hypothetical protein